MKFVELKSSLSDPKDFYVISGEDRFLCYNALELFQKRFGCNFPDFNSVNLDGEKVTANEIVEACYVLPFGDDKRLVVVKDYKSKDNAGDISTLNSYLDNPSSSTILVFFCTEQNDFYKKFSSNLVRVDCNKIDDNMLAKWIRQNSKLNNISFESGAMELLIEYCSSNLAKISSELNKLSGFVGNDGVITSKLIEELVVPEKEYQVYELTEQLAKKNSDKVFDILNLTLERDKNAVSLLQMIYTHFRRLLMISLSDGDDTELSTLLNVKPYAIKMMRMQTKNFSPKSLKKIVSLLSKLEENIKSGKMSDNVAIVYSVCNILLIG